MKKILISLTLLLTISIASTETPTTNVEKMDKLTKGQLVLREARQDRKSRNIRTTRIKRESRESNINKTEKTNNLSYFRISRKNRENRENRFIVQTKRENRKIRQVLVPTQLHFASLN